MYLHPTFLFDLLKCLMLFTNLHSSSIKLLHDGDQLKQLMRCTVVRVSSVLFLHNENLPCVPWPHRISLFTCSSMQTKCVNQAY